MDNKIVFNKYTEMEKTIYKTERKTHPSFLRGWVVHFN